MASNYMTDISTRISVGGIPKLEHSTNRKNDVSTLDMTDFLNLMVVQLQNQTIDNTMDTSDMLNQMVQMQMITALTNMTDASVMSYASSLVGKEVTIGDYSSDQLEEKVVTITGSGMSNGKQVLFVGDEVYNLSSVMAVGRLPKKTEETDEPTEGGDKPVEGTDKPAGGGDKPVEGTDKPAGGGDKPVEGTDKPVEGSEGSGGTKPDPEGEPDEDTSIFTQEQRANLIQYLRDKQVEVSDDMTDEELVEAVRALQSAAQG